jgi:hypothetical protein
LLCEGTRTDVQATLDEYAGYAKDLAKELWLYTNSKNKK